MRSDPGIDRRLTALNAICPYYTMFPLVVPLRHLSRARPDEVVLDPFCGRGSTNYAARLLGLDSVGMDSNPVAAAIAAAKGVSVSPDRVVQECKIILAAGIPRNELDIPEGEFWSLCYEDSTLEALCRVRAALLRDCRSPSRKALRALILGRLHGPVNRGLPSYLSNQMPRTYAAKPNYAIKFWRTRDLLPAPVDLLTLVERVAPHYFGALPRRVACRIICADSRTFDMATIHPKAAWVITSPPYYGMRTYVPDQWLRYWFLGGPPEVLYQHAAQIQHASPSVFVEQLAEVWRNVARACSPDVKMVIRFGGIRDRNVRPAELLRESLQAARAGWRTSTVRSAGLATYGKRQAKQFRRPLENPLEEFDFHVRLDA